MGQQDFSLRCRIHRRLAYWMAWLVTTNYPERAIGLVKAV
jgi:hypothetical protein